VIYIYSTKVVIAIRLKAHPVYVLMSYVVMVNKWSMSVI